MKSSFVVLASLFYLLISCDESVVENQIQFQLLESSRTNIEFENQIEQNFDFNFLLYPYIYIGGGVAVGDVNNDGLSDIYFSANLQSNKLYINQGNFEFKDVTQSAGVSDDEGWSTGVNMIDINNDGLLDIYVCKSGSLKNDELRRNKLYVNQGNNQFNEEAKKWGLDQKGFSIQSYFFDYDKDGDLDMYLVNHREDFQNARKIDVVGQINYSEKNSDQLFRNDGSYFSNVTQEAGVQNKAWGLSASIGDFNEDGWPDIYVANDYIQPDYLYINNKDGSFSNQILERFKHISYNSMGSDFADINNDMLPDLVVLDMLADDHGRGKENMATMNPKGFEILVKSNYHHAYMSNMLHLNVGNGQFNEIGQLSGVSKTDWSWAPLLADFDNDGFKDLFITNGIERDLNNQDYRKNLNQIINLGLDVPLAKVEQMMPTNKLENYMFRNLGDLEFKNKTKEWGFGQAVNSNGVAYADFDNDGDLDLVMNNMSEKAMLYKNNAHNNFISIALKGDQKNVNAIGAKVNVFTDIKKQSQENYLARGYQSSVDHVLNFGLGEEELIDSIIVQWGDETQTVLKNIIANRKLLIEKQNQALEKDKIRKNIDFFQQKNVLDLGISIKESKDAFDDFSKQALLPHKQSQDGLATLVGDVNKDGLADLFFGGGSDQAGLIYLQTKEGQFKLIDNKAFEQDKMFTDLGGVFFDAENDGDLDLYLTSGGYSLADDDPLLQDRLYINDGNANFTRSDALPNMKSSTKHVTSSDYDNDGDQDIFIGGRVISGKYPLSPRSFVLRNTKGVFQEVTHAIAPAFAEIGMVNDLLFNDFDNDGDEDLFVVGEWMPITLFENKTGNFEILKDDVLENSQGWWNDIEPIDINKDGLMDYVVGNLGKNNKFHPTIEKPLHIYSGYFDDNDTYDMVLSKDYKGNLVPVRGKECSTVQNPFLQQKIKSYKDFASSTLFDIYGKENIAEANHLKITELSSILLLRKSNGEFEMQYLPNATQMGPIKDIEIVDVDNDGNLDILGVGAIYDTEVETIRYDGNSGFILFGNSLGELNSMEVFDLKISGNIKTINEIKIGNQMLFICRDDRGVIQIYKYQ